MTTRTYLRLASLLGAAGTAFSGYLGWTRLSSGICAFNDPCPLFFGYPACYFGFALFATALAISLVALLARAESTWPMAANSLVGTVGLLFAGRMTALELPAHAGYRLGLPTCAYGLIFFFALVALSLAAWAGRSGHGRLTTPA